MMAMTLQKVLLILALIILIISISVFIYSWYRVTGRKIEEREIEKSLIDVDNSVDGSLITDVNTIIKPKESKITENQK